jgi:16S rRNA (guanine966-N2)-methyltransferase
VRVIAGSARGRPLVAPRGTAIRPTTDKVKGAIFSMLDAEAFRRTDGDDDEFPFRRVLDLHAGTGALGIEALSRGAQHCDFVDTSSRARAAIQENLRRTGLVSGGSVHAFSAARAVSTFNLPYDLILADPPYADPAVPMLLANIGSSGIVHERTLLIIEHARSVELPREPGRLRLARSRYHGTTAISLYHHGDV